VATAQQIAPSDSTGRAASAPASAPATKKFTKDPMTVGLLSEKQWAVGSMALDRKPADRAALKQALADTDPVVRRFAVFGLERLGIADPASASVAEDILPLLKDGETFVRQQAAVSLGKLKSPKAVAPLLAALSSDDLSLRAEAFVALGLIGDPATQGDILKALGDKRLWTDLDMWAQRFALGVLERPFFTDKAAIPFLHSLLKLKDWDNPAWAGLMPQTRAQQSLLISNAAADILASKFDDPAGEDLLIEAFTTEDDYMHQSSIEALGKIRSKKAIPALVKQLDSEWTANRRRAITALGLIGDASAVPALEKVLAGPDERLRAMAAAALEKIDGKKRVADANDPAAVPAPVAEANLATPGGKRPPQFICLGVDDCANADGLESMLDICQTLQGKGSKAVFTMWLAPLIGDWEVRDMEKQTLLVRRLFDMGCEIAHHTLMHNPEGKFWTSQPPAIQVREIEGCTQWDRSHIPGFLRPFSHKGGGGGSGTPFDPNFSKWLTAKQNFLYSGGGRRNNSGPDGQLWPEKQPAGAMYRINTGCLDAAAPPVHAHIADPIFSDYGGRFEYELPDGVAMWKANFDYHYILPRRPILAVNAFHDWGLRQTGGAKGSHRNEGRILKEFLVDVLVTNKDKYPDAYCVTYRQVVEYVASDGDLKHTLDAGNCQDSRNPVKPKID
jgi:HEAT repeat protein